MRKELRIWIIEDDKDNIAILKKRVEGMVQKCILDVCPGIRQAQAYFEKLVSGSTPLEQWPDLVFLDLGLPDGKGMDFLKKIRSKPKFEKLPILVWTNSKLEADVVNTYKHGATVFLRKVDALAGLKDVLQQLIISNQLKP